MPVLYGVFLYMGASSLRGIQVGVISACKNIHRFQLVGVSVGVELYVKKIKYFIQWESEWEYTVNLNSSYKETKQN